jgi:hypothetical protein
MMQVKDATEASYNNRAAIKAATTCSCYQCMRTFPASDVWEFIDSGETALCPICDIDSVLPEEVPIETLRAMNEHWFCGTSDVPASAPNTGQGQ